MLLAITVRGQNLFANPGFEDINNCVEYHADCAPEAWFNIPATNFLVKGRMAPKPVLGNMVLLVPVSSVLPGFRNKRRFVYTLLACPLQRDIEYALSFFIHTGGRLFEKLDFYFTDTEPTLGSFNVSGRSPSFSITPADIDDDYKMGWKHVKRVFKAEKGMRYCVIGNFSSLDAEIGMKESMNSSGDIFYFLDEMVLKPVNALPVCSGYAENIKLAYAQNFRHSDDVKVIRDTVPLKKLRVVTDTIAIPAVFFNVDSDEMAPGIFPVLDSAITRIISGNVTKIEVYGHTDSTGSPKRNRELSMLRAGAVKKYLSDRMPQFPGQWLVEGRAHLFPVAGNATEAGRRRNRRVEIILTTLSYQ